jgi:hypothetical protein
MATDPGSRSRRWLQAAAVALLPAVAGCAQSAAVAVAPGPIPPGQARIWFYRDYEPYESKNLANVDLNGAFAVSVENGSSAYRDVPPGHYHIAPESFGKDFNQEKDVDLAPGQEIYTKIVSLRTWISSGDKDSFERDTFYAWLIPPQVAQAEIARDRGGI